MSNGQIPARQVSGLPSLTVQDENGNVSTAVTQLDFQGAGVTATAGTGEVIVTIPGGGSGGTGIGAIPYDSKTRTTGNYTISSTTWAAVDNAMDLTVDAEAGDVLLVMANGLWNDEASEGHLNAGTVVGGSVVNLIEPVASKGITSWWGRSSVIFNLGTPFRYVVQAGDVAAGTVTLRLQGRKVGTANKTLFGGSTGQFYFQWSVLNLSRVGQDAAAGSSGITVQDENGNVGTGVTQIDFQGAGVTATAGTGEVVVTIAGGGGTSGDIDGGTASTTYLDFIDGGSA